MPPIIIVAVSVAAGSAVLALIVARGWCSLRARMYDAAENHGREYDGQDDFGNAFALSFACGLAMAVATGWVVALSGG